MKSKDVVDIYHQLQKLGIQIWIDGGWATDALLGEQTREHSDLDIAIEKRNVPKLRQLLEPQGFKDVPRNDTVEWNFHLGDGAKEVDVHVMEFDEKGNGIYGPKENGVFYPADSLTGIGNINGTKVRCISPEWLIKFHSGYELKEKDFRDVSALCKKFNIPLPEEFNKFVKNN